MGSQTTGRNRIHVDGRIRRRLCRADGAADREATTGHVGMSGCAAQTERNRVVYSPVGTRASAKHVLTVDGNEAGTSVVYRTNEVIAIYPITPAAPMGECADEWSAHGRLSGVVR
jgi:hypothetical protein